jgi:hypothetical protein
VSCFVKYLCSNYEIYQSCFQEVYLKLFPFNPELRSFWKLYPLRIPGPRLSSCCRSPTALVQSMAGGFVTQNCSRCGKYETLSKEEFRDLSLWVACPSCRKPMEASYIFSNYGYKCVVCDIGINLSDLLPRWEDLL